jgi:hypothetical protein
MTRFERTVKNNHNSERENKEVVFFRTLLHPDILLLSVYLNWNKCAELMYKVMLSDNQATWHISTTTKYWYTSTNCCIVTGIWGYFSTNTVLPPHKACDHEIPLKEDDKPPNIRPYRVPQKQKDEVENLINTMLADNIIRPSTSLYSSPAIVVRKKMGLRDYALIIENWTHKLSKISS